MRPLQIHCYISAQDFSVVAPDTAGVILERSEGSGARSSVDLEFSQAVFSSSTASGPPSPLEKACCSRFDSLSHLGALFYVDKWQIVSINGGLWGSVSVGENGWEYVGICDNICKWLGDFSYLHYFSNFFGIYIEEKIKKIEKTLDKIVLLCL